MNATSRAGGTGSPNASVASKKNLRLLLADGLPDPRGAGETVKTLAGGLLVQARDAAVVDDMPLTVVTQRAPSEREYADLRFAYLRATPDQIAERLARRERHFFPPALAAAQFADLEEPGVDESVIVVPLGQTPAAGVDAILTRISSD